MNQAGPPIYNVINVYIEREREREREGERYILYIYICVYIERERERDWHLQQVQLETIVGQPDSVSPGLRV